MLLLSSARGNAESAKQGAGTSCPPRPSNIRMRGGGQDARAPFASPELPLLKARLIANPSAGGGAILKVLQEVNSLLLPWAGHLDIFLTTRPGDARTAAHQAVVENYDTLITAGGDGTLNECLNGVAEVPQGLKKITFGVLPGGTANDFAATLGMPSDPIEASLELTAAPIESVDLCQLDDHYFVNVSAGGFIAEASGALSPGFKAVAGKLAYFIGGMQALIQGEARYVRIETRGGSSPPSWSQNVLVFAVANASSAGGGKPVAPRASIQDGLLDLLTIEPMPMTELVGLIPQLTSDDPPTDPRVRRLQAQEISMTFDDTISVNADGEPREVRSCVYRVFPGTARFFRGSGPFDGEPPV